MTTEWQTVIKNTSNCRSVIGTLTPTVYLWAIPSLGMDGRTAYTKNCALSHSTHSTCVHRRFCLRSLRCLALSCSSSRCSADTATLRTSKFSKRFRCSNQVLTFMWMYVCPVLQKLYKNVMIYIFMIVDILFNAYTSRYVAVGNTEIRNTQAFWETTELSTTTTSFVCTVFSRYGLGRYRWNGDWFVCLPHIQSTNLPFGFQGWSALLEHTTTPPWSFWLYCRVACLPGNPAWWDASACHFISWKWWCLYLMSQEMMSVFCFFVICSICSTYFPCSSGFPSGFVAETVEYVLFVRHAWMWPDTDLAIFIYKCTFHPLLWTFVLHPVLRHLVQEFFGVKSRKAQNNRTRRRDLTRSTQEWLSSSHKANEFSQDLGRN